MSLVPVSPEKFEQVPPLSPPAASRGAKRSLSFSEPPAKRSLFSEACAPQQEPSSVPVVALPQRSFQLFVEEPETAVVVKKLLSPPPKPQKVSPAQMLSPYKKMHDKLSQGTLVLKDQTHEVALLDSGSYVSVYEIRGDETRVVKAFHGQKMGFAEKVLASFVSHAIDNYKAVQALGLNVATIDNVETAENDRYIIQKKVENTIDCTNDKQMEQIELFLNTMLEKGVMMDLQPQNFRAENDIVYLVDFLEEETEQRVLVNLAAREWLKLPKMKKRWADKILAWQTRGNQPVVEKTP